MLDHVGQLADIPWPGVRLQQLDRIACEQLIVGLHAGSEAAVQVRGAQLKAGLQGLAAKHKLGPVRGQGLLQAMDVPGDMAPPLVEALRERADSQRPGLLVNPARPGTLRLMPALNVGAGEIDLALAMLDEAITTALAR